MLMTGTLLNALGIFIGAVLGLMLSRQPATSTQVAWRGLMGVATVYVGLRITWLGLGTGGSHMLKQVAIIILSLTIGGLLGRLLRIQKAFNRLGQYATRRSKETGPDDPNRINDGFVICTLLFCAGPLGPVGAIQDGLTGNWQPLAVKMVMDGLAAMGFVTIFGWGVVLSALPLFVYQTAITLAAHRLEPFLREHQLLDAVNAVSGMLIFCVALIVLEFKKLELATYLPSLAVAPVIAWFWR
jgi:uncharacterized membrane protein YqgA involved in biofilm formation